MQAGSTVRFRERYWVLLPHEDPQLYVLRPFTSASEETITIHKRLTDLPGYTLPEERPQPAAFPPPNWNPKRRDIFRPELDAYYIRLYDLTRKQPRHILDPRRPD